MSTFYVIIHALLWSLMEVEMEGKRGWMYDSQTQCSGIFAFTWYHIIMNLIAMMTVTFIIRPNIVGKTPEQIIRTFIIWLYNLLVWFIVEDVGWFVVNGMTYRTAPWQTTTAAVLSTVLPVVLTLYMFIARYQREYLWDWLLLPTILYIWLPFGSPFDANEPFTPRNTYCNE